MDGNRGARLRAKGQQRTPFSVGVTKRLLGTGNSCDSNNGVVRPTFLPLVCAFNGCQPLQPHTKRGVQGSQAQTVSQRAKLAEFLLNFQCPHRLLRGRRFFFIFKPVFGLAELHPLAECTWQYGSNSNSSSSSSSSNNNNATVSNAFSAVSSSLSSLNRLPLLHACVL